MEARGGGGNAGGGAVGAWCEDLRRSFGLTKSTSTCGPCGASTEVPRDMLGCALMAGEEAEEVTRTAKETMHDVSQPTNRMRVLVAKHNKQGSGRREVEAQRRRHSPALIEVHSQLHRVLASLDFDELAQSELSKEERDRELNWCCKGMRKEKALTAWAGALRAQGTWACRRLLRPGIPLRAPDQTWPAPWPWPQQVWCPLRRAAPTCPTL